jgi:O-antigen/teichoic acid export membrane protein
MLKSTFGAGLPFAGHLAAHVANPLYRTGYALTLSSGLTSVLGLAYWLLAARFYPAEVVGMNSAAIAAMTFLSGLAGLSLDGAYVRFVPRLGAQAP